MAGPLARHPAVERVWLFGSRARGDNLERSDIDLAIERRAWVPHEQSFLALGPYEPARAERLLIKAGRR